MTKILGIICILTVILSGLNASKNATINYTVKGNVNETYLNMMDHDIKDLGYRIPDPRKGVNDVYVHKYGSTTLDILNFMTIVNDEKIKPLLEIDPRLAGFNPFNLVGYKHKSKDETVISHLTASAMIDMLGITDTKLIETYKETMHELDTLVSKTFPSAVVSHHTYEGDMVDTMLHFEMLFERPEDLDDFIDEIQENIEDAFIGKGYIMAGYFNYMGNDDLLPSYDAFWTYSLCHYVFSNTIFDNKDAMPHASVFAPCTMYLYIKKGTNILVLGMPKISNWERLFPMNNKRRKDYLEKLSVDIPGTFKNLGFKIVK